MPTSRCWSLCLIFLCLLFASSAEAYTIAVSATGYGSKWEPGPTSAIFFNPASPPGTPGSATWSLMPAGIPISLGDLGPYHNSTFVSSSVVGMAGLLDVGGEAYEIWTINDALNKWSAVSGFTNLGMVEEGLVGNGDSGCGIGLYNGCADVGDIRIGAYPFNIVGGSKILGHSWQPGTTALLDSYGYHWGSEGGDMHLNSDRNQVTWVDDPSDTGTGGSTYDFYTVVLHELGHSLGLGHSTDPNSVMAMYSTRGTALRTLTDDDVAGIQAIYGPNVIPEPGTLTLLGLGLGGLALAAWRRRK